MANWGAVSSWVAAGLSAATFGAGSVRTWWDRPQGDWALDGLLKARGRGPAHRVSVYIRRGDSPETQTLASVSLVKPGDSIQLKFGVFAEHWDDTYLWVKWTPPPIRRHREKTSGKLPVSQHVALRDDAER